MIRNIYVQERMIMNQEELEQEKEDDEEEEK